jgi:hypothetical protein
MEGHMRKLITFATAVTMASLFAVMFWSQVGLIAMNHAGAHPNAKSYAITADAYLPIQRFEPAY